MADKPNALEPPKGIPAKALDELFHGPLEDFTTARNELAKTLRSDGDTAAADWVKGLGKPTRAAWLVNQLSVRKADDVAELMSLGKKLRDAQEEMLAGSADRDKLREAARSEQRVVDSLVRAAEAIAGEHGAGAQILTRVGETLQAARADLGGGVAGRRRSRGRRGDRARPAHAGAEGGVHRSDRLGGTAGARRPEDRQGTRGRRAPGASAAGQAPQDGRAQAGGRGEEAQERARQARAGTVSRGGRRTAGPRRRARLPHGAPRA